MVQTRRCSFPGAPWHPSKAHGQHRPSPRPRAASRLGNWQHVETRVLGGERLTGVRGEEARGPGASRRWARCCRAHAQAQGDKSQTEEWVLGVECRLLEGVRVPKCLLSLPLLSSSLPMAGTGLVHQPHFSHKAHTHTLTQSHVCIHAGSTAKGLLRAEAEAMPSPRAQGAVGGPQTGESGRPT